MITIETAPWEKGRDDMTTFSNYNEGETPWVKHVYSKQIENGPVLIAFGRSQEEAHSVARVASAAPELYRACRRAMDAIDWDEIDTEDKPEDKTGSLLRQALAKAEGK